MGRSGLAVGPAAGWPSYFTLSCTRSSPAPTVAFERGAHPAANAEFAPRVARVGEGQRCNVHAGAPAGRRRPMSRGGGGPNLINAPGIQTADSQAGSRVAHHLGNRQRFPTKQPQGHPRLARRVELPACAQGRGDPGLRANPSCHDYSSRIGDNQPRMRKRIGSAVHLHHESQRTSRAFTRQQDGLVPHDGTVLRGWGRGLLAGRPRKRAVDVRPKRAQRPVANAASE